ncbi:MAG TPA: PD-(D/E)XK nuclease family protein [Actinomycetes bacterium]|nr:PD-(D/E)XK nuclease family protein [Actinomycetes bacterium]
MEMQPQLPGIDVPPAAVASPSALDRYRHCPRLYRFLYVDGLWEYSRSSASQAFGTGVHAALRDLFRLPPHRRSADVLVRRFEASYAREGGGGREQRAQERARGAEVLRRWYERADTLAVPYATEVALTATWDDVTLKGRLDRVDRAPGGLRVIDYKTGLNPASQERADADPALTVYAALAQRRLGLPVTSLVLDYVAAGVQVRTERPPPVLAERLAEVLATARALRDDTEFRPRTGPWCARCDLLPRCDAGQAQVRLETEEGFAS